MELSLHHSSPPTMSHQDMARPPHEDPEYQRQVVGNIRMNLLAAAKSEASPIQIPTIASNPSSASSSSSSSGYSSTLFSVQPSPPTFSYTPTSSMLMKHHHKLSPRPASVFPYPPPSSPPALLSLSAPVGTHIQHTSNTLNRTSVPQSPSRRMRGENKKCRKVYGMEHRELWCTQCKWKKACSRFGD